MAVNLGKFTISKLSEVHYYTRGGGANKCNTQVSFQSSSIPTGSPKSASCQGETKKKVAFGYFLSAVFHHSPESGLFTASAVSD